MLLKPVLSDEQEKIVAFMTKDKTSKCCIVHAFAGSGKTWTIEKVAQERFALNLGCTLLLTYSSQLKTETREQTKYQDGIRVESMHSLVRNILYVDHDCITDDDIIAYLNLTNKPMPHKDFLQFVTLIAIDEMQDLSPLYYRLVQQLRFFFTIDNPQNPQPSLLGTGDIFQWIFHSLNGSLIDYMCRPQDFFDADEFVFLPLTYSFRLTAQVCEWINTSLNPNAIKLHYPKCWAKYGTYIEKYWGNGLRSAKCKKCGTIHLNTPEKCEQVYSAKILFEQEVSCTVVDTFKEMLTPPLAKRAKTNNATVIVNGLQVERFRKHYPNATSAAAMKGCEVRNTIVVGCDSFTEEICASSPNSQPEDWPFQCFCQMYVSCSRPRHKLFTQQAKSKFAFFTMRRTRIDVVGSSACLKTTLQIEEQRRKQVRNLSKVFEFISHEVETKEEIHIDQYLISKNVVPIKNNEQNFRDAPDIAPGLTPGTVIRHFKQNYYTAIIKAMHLNHTENKEIINWTGFMREIILFNKGDTIGTTWQADHVWCKSVLQRALSLIKILGCQIYGECLIETVQMRLKSQLHFTAKFGSLIQVIFSNDVYKLHEAMMTFLSFRAKNRYIMVTDYYVLKPLTNEVLKLTLDVHPDFYFGEIVRRKQWDFLLSSSFTLEGIVQRGIAIPVKRSAASSIQKTSLLGSSNKKRKT